jgi:hypothetical protein
VTTNCDLDEVRHIAQQKFLELVESGVEWKKAYDRNNRFGFITTTFIGYSFGPWLVRNSTAELALKLKGEKVWHRYRPYQPEEVEYVVGKGGAVRPRKTKAWKEYQKAEAEFDADPIVVAIRKIEKVHTDRECEARRKQMEDALKTSCKALQEALKDPATTLPPPTYTEHTEPYSASTGHSGRRYPWWQFWRGL